MLFCFFYDINYSPVLGLAQRTGFHDEDGVTDSALVLLVVGNELGGLFHELAVERMLLLSFYRNDNGLVHLVADHYACSFLTKISFNKTALLVLFFFFSKDSDHKSDIPSGLFDF